MSPDDPRHGTRRGYYAHRRDSEDACDSCKRAAATTEARYQLARSRGQVGRVAATGTRRRIQALSALGWTFRELDRRLGRRNVCTEIVYDDPQFVHTTTAAKVAGLYEQLSMRFPVERTAEERASATRARGRARRKGWPPPLAWDDIDDPAETPRGWQYTDRHGADELAAQYDELRRQGYDRRGAAERMGISKKRLEKAIERQSRRLREAS